MFIEEFNNKERLGITNIIIPSLTKVGQNVFANEMEHFHTWLESLNKNAVYKALLQAHTASDL